MWMDARMDEWIPRSLSLFSNLRTQLPGETMMTPLPHTQPAHRGPPAGDTLHKAVTTAVNKVSQHRNGHACVHRLTQAHTYLNICTVYIQACTCALMHSHINTQAKIHTEHINHHAWVELPALHFNPV